MSLVSYEFAVFFLVLCLCCWLVPAKGKTGLLLLFSILFYLSGGAAYLLYPLFTAVTAFFLGKKIGRMTEEGNAYIKGHELDRKQKNEYSQTVKKRQRRLLLCGLLLNFGILAVLKYTNFVLSNVEALLHMAGVQGEMEYASWALPLGISYYTFSSMGYLIDIYQRKYEPETNFLRFGLFVLFFPQMTTGPISRYDQMKPEFLAKRRIQWKQVVFGAERMLWGYFKKLVVADRLGPAASMLAAAPEDYGGIWFLVGMVFHTAHLYMDFSGGMDIVLGAAQILGIRLPENFDRPFASRSLAELWRRWHMTLMQWFREYVFFPISASGFCRALSGPVKKKFGKKAAGRVPVYTATLGVWLLTGIWHGASWNYVFWGLANGVVLLVSQELSGVYRRYRKACPFTGQGWYRVFEMARTFFVFAFLQMFLYYPVPAVFSQALRMFAAPGFGTVTIENLGALGLGLWDLIIVGFGLLLAAAASSLGKTEGIRERLWKLPFAAHYGAVFSLFLVVLVTGVYGPGYDAGQFVYTQF